jgi:hypothetical protein
MPIQENNGLKLDDNMKVSLVKEALAMAYNNCIHKQKTSFIILIEEYNIVAQIILNLLKIKALY